MGFFLIFRSWALELFSVTEILTEVCGGVFAGVGEVRVDLEWTGWGWGLGRKKLAVGDSAPPPNQRLIGSVDDKSRP